MRTRLLALMLVVAVVAPMALDVATPAAAHALSTKALWTVQTAGWDRTSSPTIADVNGDGVNDIVIGHEDGRVRVINAANGANLPGWPQRAIVSGSSATAIDSTPAVADLYKNGQKEIIVGAGSTWFRHQQGGVVVFNANGSTRCRFRTRDNTNLETGASVPDGYSEGVYSSPAIGDITGDGYPDIVFGAWDRHIYALDRYCHKILDMDVEDTVWSSPALYDVNGDGRLDILIGADQYAGGFIDWSGGEFRAIAWTPGGAKQLWKRQISDTIYSSPAIGDIDGDGRVEVVVGAGHYYHREDGRRVYAWHADDGSTVHGWPVLTSGYTDAAPALADVTGDGRPEVVVGLRNGRVMVFRGNGSVLWSRQMLFDGSRAAKTTSAPIVVDMNGDGQNDVGIGTDWSFMVFNGRTGAVMAEISKFMAHEASAAVGYFGSAGWKLVVAGFDTPRYLSKLQVFNMPPPKGSMSWGMFRRDPAHRAGPVGKNLLKPGYCRRSKNPPSTPSASSSHGYWVLGVDGAVYALKGAPGLGGAKGRVSGWAVSIAATRSGNGYYVLDKSGQIFTFGDAHSYGSMRGKAIPAPIIGLAPTPTGKGYLLAGRDGSVYRFGDAVTHGSMRGKHLNSPMISIAMTRSGRGYWMLAADGGVFSFGDASFHGSTGNLRLAAPIISMAAAPSGAGYWLVARDGGVFSFDVPFYGSVPGMGLCRPPAGMQIRPTLTGHGYFVPGSDGRVFPFGDALAGASAPPLGIYNFAVDLTVRP